MCVRLSRCCGAASHPAKGGSILRRHLLPFGYLFAPGCFRFAAVELHLPWDTSAFSADGAQTRSACLLPLVPWCWAELHSRQVCLHGRFYVWRYSPMLKSTLKAFCSHLALVAVGRRYRGGPFCCNSHAVPLVGCRIPPCPQPCCPAPPACSCRTPGQGYARAGVMGGATGHPSIRWS